MTGGLTESDKKRLKLMGITKAARDPIFRGGARKETSGNFADHICYFCGNAVPCEMERCDHAVCVRVMPCCKPAETVGWKR